MIKKLRKKEESAGEEKNRNDNAEGKITEEKRK